MSNLSTTPTQSVVQTVNNIKIWNSPESNSCKINFDASWADENNLARYGLIVRSETRTTIQAGSETFHASSSKESEARTLLEAARWTTSMNCKHFSIEGDCNGVIDFAQGKTNSIDLL